MASAKTISRVFSLTPGFPLSAIDTAAADNPSFFARSFAVIPDIVTTPYRNYKSRAENPQQL
jgi:hypothetical protein